MAVPDKSVCVHIFFVSNGHPGGVVVVILHFPGLLERLRVQIRLRVRLAKVVNPAQMGFHSPYSLSNAGWGSRPEGVAAHQGVLVASISNAIGQGSSEGSVARVIGSGPKGWTAKIYHIDASVCQDTIFLSNDHG